jgi:hypothetical protein
MLISVGCQDHRSWTTMTFRVCTSRQMAALLSPMGITSCASVERSGGARLACLDSESDPGSTRRRADKLTTVAAYATSWSSRLEFARHPRGGAPEKTTEVRIVTVDGQSAEFLKGSRHIDPGCSASLAGMVHLLGQVDQASVLGGFRQHAPSSEASVE